jgi:hypothetical protein
VTPDDDAQEWPDELDAVVAAPDHHSVLFENDRVRVLDAVVERGATVPVHTHRWPGVQYLMSTADFVRRDADGVPVIDSRTMKLPEAPFVLWSDPIGPHTLENLGTGAIRAIVVELKSH